MNQARIKGAGRNISGLLFRNRYFVIASVIILVLAASVYLLFSSPKYKVSMELTASGDWELSTTAIKELRSETTIKKAVNALGLQVSYYRKGTFTTKEIYGDSLPIKLIPGKGGIYTSPVEITVNLINGSVYRIDQNNVFTDVLLYHPVKHGSLSYTIIKGPAFKPIQPPLVIKLTPSANLTEHFSKSLNAKVLSSNIFELSINADNAQKGQDFLKKLVEIINAEYTKAGSPTKPAVVDTQLLAKLNDSITYYKAVADKYHEQQAILNNIKKPRQMPKPRAVPVLVTVKTALTEKERAGLNTLTAVKAYALKPNDAFVIIPDNYQISDYRIEALIQDFNKAQLNKQRVMQDSDNAEASVYAFKLELNSIKEALVNSITVKEQKIRNAHQTKEVRQLEYIDQPKDAEQSQDSMQPKDVDQPKDSKSIASFLSLQLNDSIAQINALIESKQQQYNRLLHGSGRQNPGPRLIINETWYMRESMISKLLLVYFFALLTGLLLPVLLLIINKYITSAKKKAAQ